MLSSTLPQKGFTLIEILLALFIFAIVASLATAGLSRLIIIKNRLDAHVARLQALQTTLTLLQFDMTQMINRPITDNPGDRLPAVLANRPGYLEFTRAGFTNPLMTAQRSTLQRVAYFVKNHTLIRRSWLVLDRAPDTQPIDRPLLQGVETFELKYLGKNQNIFNSWPPSNTQNQSSLPKAVSVTLNIEKEGALNVIYPVNAVDN